jgi:hypothetical protein
MAEFKFPTEEVELPSKGLLYPENNPLRSGKVEIKYMTAKEEDILSNASFIQKGIVLDKLLESVIVSKININDLIVGDKNALLIATRILGYGKNYQVEVGGKEENIDLTQLENNPFNHDKPGINEFHYTLPHSGNEITYKILNGHDEKKIDRELEGLKKISPNSTPTLTTRLKHIITSVDGNTESKDIREFVDNYLLARDSRAFREHIKLTQPDVDLSATTDSGEEVKVPIGLNFFWPDF